MLATAVAMSPIKPVARPKPNKPHPTVKPPRIDLPIPAPITIPIKQTIIGINTDDPASLIYLNTVTIKSIEIFNPP